MAPDTISAHDVSVKILRRFRAEHSGPHHKIFKKRRAVCRLAFGFSGPPCFLIFQRDLFLIMLSNFSRLYAGKRRSIKKHDLAPKSKQIKQQVEYFFKTERVPIFMCCSRMDMHLIWILLKLLGLDDLRKAAWFFWSHFPHQEVADAPL